MHRVLFLSHVYIDPATRGKLRALTARGLEVTVAVPQRWRERALGRAVETAWERQGGVEVFPVPVSRSGDPALAQFGRRALGALVRDKRPDLIQVEEEPTSVAARQAVTVAGRLGIPAVLFSADNLSRRLPLFTRWRRRRLLKRLRGVLCPARYWCDCAEGGADTDCGAVRRLSATGVGCHARPGAGVDRCDEHHGSYSGHRSKRHRSRGRLGIGISVRCRQRYRATLPSTVCEAGRTA